VHIPLERDRDALPDLVAARAELEDRLDQEDRGDLSRPLEKCGWMELFRCTCCGARHLVPYRCKKRYCPVCSPLIAARLVDRYKATLCNIKWPLFVTWTAFHSPLFPIPSFQYMFSALKKIRRQTWFEDKVRGGIVSGEVSNAGKNGWHIHLHSILDCRWLSVTTLPPPPFADQQKIRRRARQSMTEVGRQWEMALDRPGSIKTQRCKGDDAVREVLKYAVKPGDLVASPDPIGPIIDLMVRTRLVRSWGCMYGHLKDAETEREGRPCDLCGEAAPIVPDSVYEKARKMGTCN